MLSNNNEINEDDETNDTSCNGNQAYMLVASEEAPIDIEVSQEALSKHNIERMATVEATAYPVGCRVTFHFERHGGADAKCSPGFIPGDRVDPVVVEPISTDPENTETTELATNDEPTDEDVEKVPNNAEELDQALEDISCTHDPKLFTLKIVVDSYDCNYSE